VFFFCVTFLFIFSNIFVNALFNLLYVVVINKFGIFKCNAMLKKVLKNHGPNIVHIRIVTKTKKSQRTKLTRKRRTKMRKNKKISQEIENEAKIKQ
jgi:hypothetical protein